MSRDLNINSLLHVGWLRELANSTLLFVCDSQLFTYNVFYNLNFTLIGPRVADLVGTCTSTCTSTSTSTCTSLIFSNIAQRYHHYEKIRDGPTFSWKSCFTFLDKCSYISVLFFQKSKQRAVDSGVYCSWIFRKKTPPALQHGWILPLPPPPVTC